jgi:hypothetical protein
MRFYSYDFSDELFDAFCSDENKTPFFLFLVANHVVDHVVFHNSPRVKIYF